MAKLCVALDVELPRALEIARDLADLPEIIYKVGYKLFVPHGVEVLKRLKGLNPSAKLFLDLKLHDIPNTVKNGVLGAKTSGANYLTVHTLGGSEMVKAAAEVKGEVKLLGVTLLTSHDEGFLKELGINLSREDFVLKLAQIGLESGCDGLVCSAHEVEDLKKRFGDFLAVVPGIRPSTSPKEDQKRVATPREAVQRGADVIVVGRPIVLAENPRKVAEEILKEIGY
jgi:orotidine-5'-phosphate decarboxylase